MHPLWIGSVVAVVGALLFLFVMQESGSEASRCTPLPVLALSHGAGPSFFTTMSEKFAEIDANSELAEKFRQAGKTGQLPRSADLKAVLVISAHWEQGSDEELYVIGGDAEQEEHHLLYDYYGFPADTYAPQLTYKMRPCPQLATRIKQLLEPAGIRVRDEPTSRGYDHGVFIPLKLLYPEEGLAVVQLSISATLDAAFHARLGAALAPLRDEGILIIGSGQVTHGRGGNGPKHEPEHAFVDWVEQRLAEGNIDDVNHAHTRAPHFAIAHPRTEHWVPLLVALNARRKGDSIEPLVSGWWHSMSLNSYLVSTRE